MVYGLITLITCLNNVVTNAISKGTLWQKGKKRKSQFEDGHAAKRRGVTAPRSGGDSESTATKFIDSLPNRER